MLDPLPSKLRHSPEAELTSFWDQAQTGEHQLRALEHQAVPPPSLLGSLAAFLASLAACLGSRGS